MTINENWADALAGSPPAPDSRKALRRMTRPLIERYLIAGDLRRRVPNMAALPALLRPIPVERAVDWVAHMLAPTMNGAAERRRHELTMAKLWFTQSPADSKALDLIQSGQRRLLAPHILLYLARLALVHCSTAPAGDHEDPRDVRRYDRLMVDAMLLVGHHAGARRRPWQTLSEGPSAVTAFELEAAANILANHVPFVASMFDRSERRWIEIPAEDLDPASVDLAGEFQAATGVPLADLRLVGGALWARLANAGGSPHFPADQFDQLAVGSDRARAALNLISASVEDLRKRAAAMSPETEYDIDIFGEHPIMRCADGSYIIISPNLLLERTIGWLPRWDLNTLKNLRPDGKKRANDADRYLRRTTELHAVETLRAVAGAPLVPATVFAENEIQSAYGTAKKNADCVLAWPDQVVVAEISSRTVTRSTAAGTSADAFLRDLDLGILTKARQLDATINAIRASPLSLLENGLSGSGASFRPVLVTTEGFPWTPFIADRVRLLLRDADVLQTDDIAPLVLIDIDGLEASEAVCARTGETLVDLIRGHENSSMSDYAFRDWLLLTHGPVRPTARVMDRWDRVFVPILSQVGDAD